MSGRVSSWAKIVGVSSRRLSRPRTTHTTSWPSMVETVRYAEGEEEALDRAIEVLDRGDCPEVALLGALDLQRGDQPCDGDVGPVRLAVITGERRDRGVCVLGKDVLDPEQRVIRDVEAEHLSLEGQQRRLVPLDRRDRRHGQQRRHGPTGSAVSGTVAAGSTLDVVVTETEACEQRVLADGLLLLLVH